MEPMTNIALRAARKAGELIVRAPMNSIASTCTPRRPTTSLRRSTKQSEQEIVRQLRRAYPDHAILGEESGRSGPDDAEYTWIIDPLDGTTNFIRGIPHYAVSIACMHRAGASSTR
jgi:myo-inositol-1(or 4)-monophosphatase